MGGGGLGGLEGGQQSEESVCTPDPASANVPPRLPPALKLGRLPRGKHGSREPREAFGGDPGRLRAGYEGRGQPPISSKRRNLRSRRVQKRPVNSWLGAEDSPAPGSLPADGPGTRETVASASWRRGQHLLRAPRRGCRPLCSPSPRASPVNAGRRERWRKKK